MIQFDASSIKDGAELEDSCTNTVRISSSEGASGTPGPKNGSAESDLGDP